jgi:hypothetical protein
MRWRACRSEYLTPEMVPTQELHTGQVGYRQTGIMSTSRCALVTQWQQAQGFNRANVWLPSRPAATFRALS